MDNIIGKRIKEAMNLRGVKQADIVKKTGINKGALSSYINGNYEPKQSNIYKIANTLNISPAWLMGYDVPMELNSDYEQKVILFGNTFSELLFYYKIKADEFAKKNNIDINVINNWLSFKSIPNDSELYKICNFFNINDQRDLFNGSEYFRTLDKYDLKNDGPVDRYQFGFVFECMLDDISDELNVPVKKIKSILFKESKNLELLATYEDLYNFLKNYFKDKLNID